MAKILVIRLTSLGDVIFTLPLVNTLKDANNEVHYLVAEKGFDLIKDNPSIDKVHLCPLAEWRKSPFSLKKYIQFKKLIKELQAEKFDIAIDCQQMFKSLFLFLFCGAKRRITFSDARELSILGGNEFVKPKTKFRDFTYHIVERNLDFARHLGITPDKIKFTLPKTSEKSKSKIDKITSHFQYGKPIVILAPATTWENKHWDNKNWAKLAEAFDEKSNLIFTGTEKDKALIDDILLLSTRPIKHFDLVGQTNLEELKELFSRAEIVISPDSGSSNLAWSCSTPAVITIFTATPAKRFGPYGDKKYTSIQGQLPCQPCFNKICKLQSEKNICKKQPDADTIIKIVNNLL